MGDTVPFAAAEAGRSACSRRCSTLETAPRTLINVNFPALPPEEVKGIRVCRQGMRDYGRLRIVQRTDPRGYDYYWFGLGPMVQTPGHSTDLEAIADGYISVTPLHLDLTHDASLDGAAAPLRGDTEGQPRVESKSKASLTAAFAALARAGGPLVDEASQVDVALHELVRVTGVPACNGQAYGQHS